jgi:hypothetical protein
MVSDMKKLLIILLTIILACSCSTTFKAKLLDRHTEQNIGMTHQELIQKYGAPVREMSDGGDGHILVFAGERVFSYRASKYGGSVPELQCYMDADGKCYSTKTANIMSKRAFSFGKTILLLIILSGLGIIII